MSRANKAQTYLYLAHAGALALIAIGFALLFGAPDFFKGLLVGILLGIILMLFRHQMRDEYIERLWNAGTQLALLTTLVTTLGAELVRGFQNPDADVFAMQPVFSSVEVGVMALAAFFIAFHVEMWRQR